MRKRPLLVGVFHLHSSRSSTFAYLQQSPHHTTHIHRPKDTSISCSEWRIYGAFSEADYPQKEVEADRKLFKVYALLMWVSCMSGTKVKGDGREKKRETDAIVVLIQKEKHSAQKILGFPADLEIKVGHDIVEG